MSDKYFFDTNLWIYLCSADDPAKKLILENILLNSPDIYVSTQVYNELSHVLHKKFNVSYVIVWPWVTDSCYSIDPV